ncbi:MAG: M23 family metallopeptidase [Pseudomonadota bacterium]|nr:M23 family metallopeptidase [Pseudomonadota bacterium]
MFGNFKLPLWLLLGLMLSGCGQRVGLAPVVHGGMGETARLGSSERAGSARTVTVRKGDALYKIARRYHVRLRSLIDANQLKPPYIIYPGQKLRLPFSDVYVVKRGETVYQIAKRYNVEPAALVRLNRISRPYRLYPGRKIVLPNGAKPQVATPRTEFRNAGSNPRVVEKRPTTSKRKQFLGTRPKISRRGTGTERSVEPPPASRGGFIWPVNGRVLSRFGAIGKGLQNDGINILARRGTPVRAVQNGVVAYAGNELRGFGNLLLLKHSGGWVSAYAHNSDLLVRTGQKVRKGQVISKVGRTGSVDMPQLHFELRRGNRAVDPERYLGRRTAAVKN